MNVRPSSGSSQSWAVVASARRLGRHGERERGRQGADAQRTVAQPDRGLPHIDARPALLWTNVIHRELVRPDAPPSEPCAGAEVGVARHRSASDDIHAARHARQLEIKPEPCPLRRPARVRDKIHVQANGPVGECRPGGCGIDRAVEDGRAGAGLHAHGAAPRLDPHQPHRHPVDSGSVPALGHGRQVGLVVRDVTCRCRSGRARSRPSGPPIARSPSAVIRRGRVEGSGPTPDSEASTASGGADFGAAMTTACPAPTTWPAGAQALASAVFAVMVSTSAVAVAEESGPSAAAPPPSTCAANREEGRDPPSTT